MTTIISLDCEANGLHGQAFAAAASVWVDGQEIETWEARCPIVGDVNPWVAENVLPAIADMPENAVDYQDLLARWRLIFPGSHLRDDTLILAHIPWPVEARFLWDAHSAIPFSGPYPLLDVAAMLHAHALNPLSVDDFLTSSGIPLPPGSPHHPLYDARAAASAYFEISGEGRA